MPRSCPSQIRYGLGTINPAPAGRFDCFLFVDGKRYRARKDSLEAARIWIDTQEDQAKADRPPLSKIQIADAAHALAILPPGFTLTDAAKAVLNNAGTEASTPLPDAVERFLAARKPFLRPRTYASYENALNRFARFAGGCLESVSRTDVEAFVAGMAPETRNSKIRCLSAFFHWAADQDLIERIPTGKVAMAKVPEPAKEILSIADVKKVMSQAEQDRPDLVPYLALGFFAGIRPAEIGRLNHDRVKARFVSMIGEVTKKHRARTIRIRPNLRAWLDAYKTDTIAPLTERNRYRAIRKLCTDAGVTWKNDCMRHSFASYGFEESGGDANGIGAEMGQKDVGVFFRNYRGLVNPGEGRKYFKIRPKK